MGDITLTLSKLLLDERNPRHRPVTTQEAAMAELIRRGPSKMLNLAKDIAAIGLNPVERPIVMKSGTGNKYVVLEGNRRLAALRLLAKPETCPAPALRAKFEALSAVAEHRPKTMRCFEVGSREEADPLLDRRHLAESRGVV